MNWDGKRKFHTAIAHTAGEMHALAHVFHASASTWDTRPVSPCAEDAPPRACRPGKGCVQAGATAPLQSPALPATPAHPPQSTECAAQRGRARPPRGSGAAQRAERAGHRAPREEGRAPRACIGDWPRHLPGAAPPTLRSARCCAKLMPWRPPCQVRAPKNNNNGAPRGAAVHRAGHGCCCASRLLWCAPGPALSGPPVLRSSCGGKGPAWCPPAMPVPAGELPAMPAPELPAARECGERARHVDAQVRQEAAGGARRVHGRHACHHGERTHAVRVSWANHIA